MREEPAIGHYLHASCSGEDYGQIIGIGVDANNTPTIDIEVFEPNDLLSFDDDGTALTRLELPPNTKAILRDVQWKHAGGYDNVTLIECRTPGNNCYRCTKLFSLNKTPSDEPKCIITELPPNPRKPETRSFDIVVPPEDVA